MRAVDVVAVILAVGLSALVVLILVATIVQIVGNTLVPEIQLSDNATQILVGSLGAFTGLLGGYIGSRAPARPVAVVTVSVTDSPARKYRCLHCDATTISWLEVTMGGRVQTPCCVRCGAEVTRA